MWGNKTIAIGAAVASAAVAGSLLLSGVGSAATSTHGSRAANAPVSGTQSFLAIPNIPGESVIDGYQNQIGVAEYDWSILGPVTKGTRTTKASFAPLHVKYALDRSVPLLELAAARGTVIPSVTLTAAHSNGAFLIVVLSQVKVSTVSISSGDEAPDAEASFSYLQEKTTYFPQNTDGTLGTPVATCWSVALNSAC